MTLTTEKESGALAHLHWVKLRSMPIFWPACIYQRYADAVAHTHDVWALRNAKPVLDSEDRVLYFFGVGPRACHVVASGVAPTLQLCVVHEDDVMLEDWTRSEEFALLCDKHDVPQNMVTRTKNNVCFLRACEEATTYAKNVQTDEQAVELFVTLLTTTKKAHTTGEAVVIREIMASPSLASVPAGEKTHKKMEDTQQPQTRKKIHDVAELLLAPAMVTIVAKCWQKMLEAGWETMTLGDGLVLYKMPGTSFLDVVPNVNLFDSLEKACARYLSEWVHNTRLESSSNSHELTEFIWPMAAESGWTSLSTTTECLYMKANTPFDQWVPNVTIFCTKTQAVIKYMEECGLVGSSNNELVEEYDRSPHLMHDDSSEGESEDAIERDGNPEGENDDANANVEGDNSEEDGDANSDVEGDSSDEEYVNKNIVSTKKLAETVNEGPSKQGKTTRRVNRRRKSISSFEMSFGKLERELKNRGWYWKNKGLQWYYYKPHCKAKDIRSLKPNVDFFRGREELEAYAYSSGLYDHVYKKLKEDHYKQYTSVDEADADSGDNKNVAHSSTISSSLQITESTPRPTESTAKKCGHSSATSTIRFQRARSKSTVHGLTSQTTLDEVKFGEIWRVLSEDGWHYRPSALEYDYFKPHCATAKDGEAGVDFFQSKDLLIEYLQTSGLWDKTAARVRAEAAMCSSDEDLINSDNEIAILTQKRKHDNSPSAFDHESKKQKDAPICQTPSANKRSAFAGLTDDDDNMGETISPDAAEAKGKEGLPNGIVRQPLRNLANSFTPSPKYATKEMHLVNATTDSTTKSPNDYDGRSMITSAIRKLTSAYIPTNFRHREKEFSQIREFFSNCFKGKERTSLYISGAPGCGKTALLKATQSAIDELYRVRLYYWLVSCAIVSLLVTFVLQKECASEKVVQTPVRCHFNAMAFADSSMLFRKLAEALTQKSFSSGNEAFEAIEHATNRQFKTSKTLILILDEIDSLSKNNGIENDLCRLFELAHRSSHNFILIGIANQVDFTERHLPMLQQRLPDCSPQVVVFEPYKHETIEQILIDRLGGHTAASKMVSLHGISFLARKIASTTGDIRLAVDTCRRVLQHKLDQAEKENPSKDVELGRPLPLTDTLRIIKHALESAVASAIRALPRNLQMILFASTRTLLVTANLAAADGSEATRLFGVSELYSCYCDMSKDAGVVKPLSERDFRTALDTLSKEGLIAEPELRKHLIKLLFSPSELHQSFRKDPFFSRLLCN
ncbi:hypothetical protein PsorP6_006368 [Peronosclerospora sorghi]|uniref:Uncharacterized protein n=1 Tax=Peronosclerospora sorghi TaxID=230839 RepID=A0ACC0W7N8_9STRA|nr:hypothetical protein PsorP6_006368 [Peronosclerospora sorghi]